MLSTRTGVVLTPELERKLEDAATVLPEDWTIEMSGNSTTGLVTVAFKGPGAPGPKSFRPNDVDLAVWYLQGLKNQRS
jgi:hypothetical protein